MCFLTEIAGWCLRSSLALHLGRDSISGRFGTAGNWSRVVRSLGPDLSEPADQPRRLLVAGRAPASEPLVPVKN
jgi:hypothetical protein